MARKGMTKDLASASLFWKQVFVITMAKRCFLSQTLLLLVLVYSLSFSICFQLLPTRPTKSFPGTSQKALKLPAHHQSSSLRISTDETVVESSETPEIPMAVSVIGSTTSFVVSSVFAAVLAWKRDALMVSFFIGAISNGALSKILKRIINHSRPPELETKTMKLRPSDGGMPSSHAMSLGFIGIFTALTLPWTQLPLLIYTILSLIYRVQAKLHTWGQVGVGLTVGCLNGVAWWHLCMGDNPWNINVMDWVTVHLLNENGVLPWPMLAIPALAGLAIVGSFERRISAWLKEKEP